MRRFRVTGLLVLALAGVCARGVRAQSPFDEPRTEFEESPALEATRFEEFSGIQEQIRVLTEENNTLQSEYEALESEFLELQETVNQRRQELKALAEERAKEESRSIQPAQESHRDETAAAETEISLKDISGDRSLEDLQMYDLYYQKKELEEDLRLKELSTRKIKQQYEERLSAFKEELEDKERPGKGHLRRQVADLDRENQDLRNKIFAFRREMRTGEKEK